MLSSRRAKKKRPAGPALRLEIASAYADLGQAWAARRTARELLREEVTAPMSLRIAIAEVLEVSGDDEGALLLVSGMTPISGRIEDDCLRGARSRPRGEAR